MTVRIAMWSGPRNISTAMMRSFENRADCAVVDEPFYAAYLAATGLDAKDFRTGFALMAAQRHARIIGLFVRLLRRDGKPEYLPHLPRVWRLFEQALQHPVLEPLRGWVDRHLPPSLRRIGAP